MEQRKQTQKGQPKEMQKKPDSKSKKESVLLGKKRQLPTRSCRKKTDEQQKKRKSDKLVSKKATTRSDVVITVLQGERKVKVLDHQRKLYLLVGKVLAQRGSVVDEDKAFTQDDAAASRYADVLNALTKESSLPLEYRARVNKQRQKGTFRANKNSIISDVRKIMRKKRIKFALDGFKHRMQICSITTTKGGRHAALRLVRETVPVPSSNTQEDNAQEESDKQESNTQEESRAQDEPTKAQVQHQSPPSAPTRAQEPVLPDRDPQSASEEMNPDTESEFVVIFSSSDSDSEFDSDSSI
ncbi:MAG: hypothetical protein MHM6MM_008211 [Cercozoa sp. M6MM]